jgi:hypothetical protein
MHSCIDRRRGPSDLRVDSESPGVSGWRVSRQRDRLPLSDSTQRGTGPALAPSTHTEARDFKFNKVQEVEDGAQAEAEAEA